MRSQSLLATEEKCILSFLNKKDNFEVTVPTITEGLLPFSLIYMCRTFLLPVQIAFNVFKDFDLMVNFHT